MKKTKQEFHHFSLSAMSGREASHCKTPDLI